jgi:hypothetical protein
MKMLIALPLLERDVIKNYTIFYYIYVSFFYFIKNYFLLDLEEYFKIYDTKNKHKINIK